MTTTAARATRNLRLLQLASVDTLSCGTSRDPDLPATLRRWHDLLAGIVSEPSGLRLLELLLPYLPRAAPRMTEEALRQVASMAGPQAEQIAMTLAEQLYEKAVKRGDRGKRDRLARQVRVRFGRLPRWAAQRLRDATGQELDCTTWITMARCDRGRGTT